MANKHNNTLHYAPNCEKFDTEVNVFPAKKERKNEHFTSYLC